MSMPVESMNDGSLLKVRTDGIASMPNEEDPVIRVNYATGGVGFEVSNVTSAELATPQVEKRSQ